MKALPSPSVAARTPLDAVRDLRREIARISGELDRFRVLRDCIRREFADIGSLQRRVAFQLHPDRGGDGETLRTLNRLFGILEEYVRGD